MSGHTPGPWTVDRLCIEAPDGNVALCNLARASKADARLIAAAPELEDALREGVAGLDTALGISRRGWGQSICNCSGGFVCSPCKSLAAMRAALAKTEDR